MEDVYHARCGHWADRPRLYHRCPAAPDQPAGQLSTAPSLVRFEQKAGIFRDHGDSTKPKPGMRMSRGCTNAVSHGSHIDNDEKCPKCRIDIDKIVANQKGMWFSCGIDKVTGKPYFRDRNPESEASKRARFGTGEDPGQFVPAPANLYKRRPQPLNSIDEDSWRESDEQSRKSSWSSHGHVEL